MAPSSVKVFVTISCLIVIIRGDTPGNCTYEDIKGSWLFHVGEGGHDRTIDCSTMGPIVTKMAIKLQYPDIAVDEFGNYGFWTLVYNQGFEVVIHGRKYFAYSRYEGTMQNATSFCDQTMPGWSHDVLGHDWSCFTGKKLESLPPKSYTNKPRPGLYKRYHSDLDLVNRINSVQSSWKATHYPQFDSMTPEDMTRLAGGTKSRILGKPKPAPPTRETLKLADTLPPEFDWRNVDGVNFVSPVRNQASCGSCFAFASLGMNEARLRIATNNSVQITLSPQDVVECSHYSQGCDGGFPYLIAGKYAEDYGLVEEDCNPYTGKDGPCQTKQSCKRHYFTAYRYVGGFYGGCNEERMRQSLVANGPMAVAFEVYSDFFTYKGGVYEHTGLSSKFNPFEITNHAVLLVGYGVDSENGKKFWIVKNSWGDKWGENGYFRIVRGVDECAIESIAVESFPIF